MSSDVQACPLCGLKSCSCVVPKPFGLALGPVAFSLVNLLIIWAGTYLVWFLFGDPVNSPLKMWPQPFNAYMFWAILVLVFIGFNLGMSGFCKIAQPLSGILATAVTIALAMIIPALLIHGYGALDPAFSAQNYHGHGAAAMVVLIGFYGFGIIPTGMGGWPWSDKLEQPLAGFSQIFLGAVLTFVMYLVLIYPSFASWTGPDQVFMALPTVVGWFYSVIVCWLTTFLVLDNWPWSGFGSKTKVALAAFFGNFVGGTIIYFVFLAFLKGILIPAEAVEAIGGAINLWPAQLGVWIVTWLIFWANIAGNTPTHFGPGANRAIRFVITWTLGILSFVFYMKWFAVGVLNEPEIIAGFGGDPLTWVDILNLVMLIWVCYFGFYGIRKKE